MNGFINMTSIRDLTQKEADKRDNVKTLKVSYLEEYAAINAEILENVKITAERIKEDSVIDKDELFDESIKQALIQSEWTIELNTQKRYYRKLKEKQDKIFLLLWKMYQNKTTPEQKEKFGKVNEHVLKTDVEKYMNADDLWAIVKETTQNQYSIVEMCEQMIDNNKQRGYIIKNAIEIKKFEAGF